MGFLRMIALALWALSPVQAEVPAAGAAPRIALSPAADGRWRVSFAFDAPVTALSFTRNPNDWRVDRWRPLDDAFNFRRIDERDVVARADNAAFRRVAFDIPARYLPLPKDYAPYSPFTDGGLLIHTGQFHACAGTEECADDLQWRTSVEPPHGAHVIVGGEILRRAEFLDRGAGTMVYVGLAKPLASSHFVAVIDAALPPAVNDALYDLLPRLMDYFSERLGPLATKPMLFASLDPYGQGGGLSSQGGTLPNQVFIHLYGQDWTSAGAQQLEGFLPWFFAHEAGHLYQFVGLDAVDYEMGQSWIHEGGAEAFAALTITRFGGATPEYVQNQINTAVTSCADGLAALEGRLLNASADAGAFGNYYACGLLIHLAINAEVRRASSGERDLFDVWARFLERLRAGASWDQDVFLAAAREFGAGSAADFAYALAETPQRDPLATIRTALTEAGVEIGGGG